jgi:hypothetical protein
MSFLRSRRPIVRILRWLLLLLVLAFLAIQLRRPIRANPPVAGDVAAPPGVAAVLRKACYDCHSNETRWPWYSEVAPISWWLADHVDHGRSHLNFSEWTRLEPGKRRDKLEEIDEEVGEGAMPLSSYKIMHSSARLTEEERNRIRSWARAER